MASLATLSVEEGSPLDDLSYHLLLNILTFLKAKELCQTAKVKLSFCILSKILYTRTPVWKTGIGKSVDETGQITSDDVVKNIDQLMNKSTSLPNLGIIFAEASKFQDNVASEIAKNTSPDTVLVGGCVSALASVNTDCEKEEDIVVETDTSSRTKVAQHSLSLACMPETYRKAFHVKKGIIKDTEAAIACLPEATDWEWKVIILLVDQSAAGAGLHEFIEAIQKKHTNAEVVGGIMGGGNSNMIVVQDQTATTYNGGIVGLAIGGKCVFSSQVSRACKPMCEDFQVVDAEGPCLKTVTTITGEKVELSGYKMASEAMQMMRGRQATFFGITDDLEKGYTLHNLRGATEEGWLVLTTDEFKTGDFCRMFLLDPDATRDDLKKRLEAAEEKCKAQSKTSLGGLLFTCGGRGYRFYKEKAVESTIFKNAMPNTGLSGFFAGGEIGPEALAMQNVNSEFRNKAAIQGFTAVYGVFFVPKFTTPSGKLLDDAMKSRNFNNI